jgi:hypothetical protein
LKKVFFKFRSPDLSIDTQKDIKAMERALTRKLGELNENTFTPKETEVIESFIARIVKTDYEKVEKDSSKLVEEIKVLLKRANEQ